MFLLYMPSLHQCHARPPPARRKRREPTGSATIGKIYPTTSHTEQYIINPATVVIYLKLEFTHFLTSADYLQKNDKKMRHPFDGFR